MADSLFVPLGDGRYQPTGLSRGPWSPNALHLSLIHISEPTRPY